MLYKQHILPTVSSHTESLTVTIPRPLFVSFSQPKALWKQKVIFFKIIFILLTYFHILPVRAEELSFFKRSLISGVKYAQFQFINPKTYITEVVNILSTTNKCI